MAENAATQNGGEKAQPQSRVEPQNLPGLEIPAHNPPHCPPSPAISDNPHLFRKQTLPTDNYFAGPRDLQRHSKWPLVLQLHGSIVPKLIMPLFLIACWSTLITVITKKVHDLGVNSVLLTILGFVVGLSLSFRSSTAYERYTEGRRYWGQLTMASQTLGRIFWIHATEPEGQDPRELILKKIGAMNLIVAFSMALKHHLRFELPEHEADIQPYIAHLDTFSGVNRANGSVDNINNRPTTFYKSAGEYLGVSFATSNPRKAIKRAEYHQGNLPLEILSHIASVLDSMIYNKQLTVNMQHTIAFNHISVMNDVMTGCDRVLNTPLPIAYTIAISQITFCYIILLPFQLTKPLGWIAIPATIAAAYIILGLLFIGQEIENPFGHDVNDLPLDKYCDQIAADMDIIASFNKRGSDFLIHPKSMPLHPISASSSDVWMNRSVDKLRQAIVDKPRIVFEWRKGNKKNKVDNSENVSEATARASGADMV
ncbi:hypothetical protein FDECE_3779 [Fusarium decemcellulare]|nr:hypothetical protein FDECE_3779 [Fusarium decemcellulare]